MKRLILICLLLLTLNVISTHAQSIVGKWQLTRQSTCIEDDMDEDETTTELVNQMKSMSGPATQIIQFKENNTAEENTKIINRRKSYNSKALLYKHAGGSLYILDKRSKTILETFVVEQLSADSLIISNSARACDTKVFIKIK
jgi:hypothetical protein